MIAADDYYNDAAKEFLNDPDYIACDHFTLFPYIREHAEWLYEMNETIRIWE
jgi:hypothetical protein